MPSSRDQQLARARAVRRTQREKERERRKKIVAGVDAGVDWMKAHPEEFAKGGKYEKLAEDDGWLTDAPTTAEIVKLLKAGQWYAKSDLYTPAWIDSNYKFAALALEATGDKVPTKAQLFAAPGAAQ